jgi:hypothetical protein
MASINSRALFESPPGAGAFIVTVAMRSSPCGGAPASRFHQMMAVLVKTPQPFL